MNNQTRVKQKTERLNKRANERKAQRYEGQTNKTAKPIVTLFRDFFPPMAPIACFPALGAENVASSNWFIMLLVT